MSKLRKSNLMLPVAGALLLLSGYVGGYCVMVEVGWKDEFPEPRTIASFPWPRYSRSESLGAAAEFLFAPVHCIDCHVRAQLWSRDRGVTTFID